MNSSTLLGTGMSEKLNEIYQKKSSRILRFINSRISSTEDSSDILQDVFLTLIESDATKPVEKCLPGSTG